MMCPCLRSIAGEKQPTAKTTPLWPLDRVVLASRGQEAPIGAEGHGEHLLGVPAYGLLLIGGPLFVAGRSSLVSRITPDSSMKKFRTPVSPYLMGRAVTVNSSMTPLALGVPDL